LNLTLPSAAAITKWASLVVAPPLSGALAAWLIVHVHVLSVLGISATSLRGAVAYLVIFVVGTVTTFLAHHNILRALYAPGGVTRSGKRRLL
jgi:hypothetical protein